MPNSASRCTGVKRHRENLGPQSKVGFKDAIPAFQGEKFDPEHLMDLYKKAGAKYFVSMGVHHVNFDLWNSKHTRWNAVNRVPRRTSWACSAKQP